TGSCPDRMSADRSSRVHRWGHLHASADRADQAWETPFERETRSPHLTLRQRGIHRWPGENTLCLDSVGQAELREQLRVEEVVVAHDLAARHLDHLDGPGLPQAGPDEVVVAEPGGAVDVDRQQPAVLADDPLA